MSVQYIFVIHVGMHQSEVYDLWIVRVVRSWEQQSVCGDDPSRTGDRFPCKMGTRCHVKMGTLNFGDPGSPFSRYLPWEWGSLRDTTPPSLMKHFTYKIMKVKHAMDLCTHDNNYWSYLQYSDLQYKSVCTHGSCMTHHTMDSVTLQHHTVVSLRNHAVAVDLALA